MQAVASSALDLACTVQRPTRTSDSAGGYSEAFATVATTTCNLRQPSAAMMQNYDYLIGALSAWQVRMPVGANVKENDHLVVGSQTLRVQVLFAPQSYQTSLLLLATEVQ